MSFKLAYPLKSFLFDVGRSLPIFDLTLFRTSYSRLAESVEGVVCEQVQTRKGTSKDCQFPESSLPWRCLHLPVCVCVAVAVPDADAIIDLC